MNTKIKSLIGQNIEGKRAIVTQPQHWPYMKKHEIKTRTLLKAIVKIEKGIEWLYIYWKPDGSRDYDCGYSGWSGSHKETATVKFV